MPPRIIGGGTLAEIMAALGADGQQDKPERKSPPDILITTLREYLADYTQPCRFAVGAIVTPKASSMMGQLNGQPFIVAEVFADPIRMSGRTDKVHNTEFAGRFDMRVLHEMSGTIVPHVVESWMFEAYVALPAPTHEANPQAN